MHKLQFFHRALARSLAKTNRVLEQAQLLFLTSYISGNAAGIAGHC
jgi:hypothetical protein